MVALGLDDAKPEGVPARAKRQGRMDTSKRETAKLKAANSIARKYPDWRALVWDRLVAIKSKWLDHAAIAALTGARPEELRTAQIRRTATGIEIGITGAKVSDTKGQPWRLFALRDDGSDEYRHIAAMASRAWRPVGLPDGVTDYPDAFSAALARAGAQVLFYKGSGLRTRKPLGIQREKVPHNAAFLIHVDPSMFFRMMVLAR